MKIQKTATLPLFYTQVIGSLPRPKPVQDLLAAREQVSPDRFTGLMDDMVLFAIRLQEQAGIDVISDGEWRRTQYIREFLQRVGGCERIRPYRHQGEVKHTDVIVRRIAAPEPVFTKDAEFLVKHTDRCTKFALPGPFLIAVRYWHGDYSKDAYPTPRHFMEHLAEILGAEAERDLEPTMKGDTPHEKLALPALCHPA